MSKEKILRDRYLGKCVVCDEKLWVPTWKVCTMCETNVSYTRKLKYVETHYPKVFYLHMKYRERTGDKFEYILTEHLFKTYLSHKNIPHEKRNKSARAYVHSGGATRTHRRRTRWERIQTPLKG